MSSTVVSPRVASFITLPGELLNQIYELALIQEDPIELWSEEVINYQNVLPQAILRESFLTTRRKLGVGLLRTCHKIRNEASRIFYEANAFRFSGSGGWDGLYRFLLALGPTNRLHVKRLGVFIPLEPRLYTSEHSISLCRGENWTPRCLEVLKNSEKVVHECCALIAEEETVAIDIHNPTRGCGHGLVENVHRQLIRYPTSCRSQHGASK